jgi:hypothetical protein
MSSSARATPWPTARSSRLFACAFFTTSFLRSLTLCALACFCAVPQQHDCVCEEQVQRAHHARCAQQQLSFRMFASSDQSTEVALSSLTQRWWICRDHTPRWSTRSTSTCSPVRTDFFTVFDFSSLDLDCSIALLALLPVCAVNVYRGKDLTSLWDELAAAKLRKP